MRLTEVYALLSVAVILFGAPFYLIDILKHKTKPQRTTWLIWSVQGLVAFVAQFQLHAKWSLLFVGFSALGNLIVYGLSLFYGVGGWSKLEIGSLIIALLGLIISIVANAPLIAIFGVIVADMAGVIPTAIKVYKAPESETTITWIALGISPLFAALSVGKFSPSLLLYPVYLAVIDFGIVGTQMLGKSRSKT